MRTVEVYSLDANRRTALGSFPPHVSRKQKVTENYRWIPTLNPRAKVTDQLISVKLKEFGGKLFFRGI